MSTVKWPLVSRKRFDRQVELKRKYRAEVKNLQQVILSCEAQAVAAAVEQQGNLDPKNGPIQPIGGRMTQEMLIARVNREAMSKAKAGGSVVREMTDELKLAAFKGRRDAKLG